jgi:hypothetical protein
VDEGQENRGVAAPVAGDAVSVVEHATAFPAQVGYLCHTVGQSVGRV